jgi:mannose-6-phosphate isomerase-like protein (cupin superfamily)
MPDPAIHTPRAPGAPIPGDAALEHLLSAEGLAPHWWSNEGGYRYQLHVHGYHKVLYCASGSVTLTLPATGEQFRLRPGDRVDLPPNTSHTAMVGPEGVRCVEGWKPV